MAIFESGLLGGVVQGIAQAFSLSKTMRARRNIAEDTRLYTEMADKAELDGARQKLALLLEVEASYLLSREHTIAFGSREWSTLFGAVIFSALLGLPLIFLWPIGGTLDRAIFAVLGLLIVISLMIGVGAVLRSKTPEVDEDENSSTSTA